jgi:predicted aspartyl protease
MGRIFGKVEVCGKICREVIALFDSGADRSFIDPKLAREIETEKTGFYRTRIPNGIKLDEVKAKVKILDKERPSALLYEMESGYPLVVGADLMQELNLKLDPSKGLVEDPEPKWDLSYQIKKYKFAGAERGKL